MRPSIAPIIFFFFYLDLIFETNLASRWPINIKNSIDMVYVYLKGGIKLKKDFWNFEIKHFLTLRRSNEYKLLSSFATVKIIASCGFQLIPLLCIWSVTLKIFQFHAFFHVSLLFSGWRTHFEVLITGRHGIFAIIWLHQSEGQLKSLIKRQFHNYFTSKKEINEA